MKTENEAPGRPPAQPIQGRACRSSARDPKTSTAMASHRLGTSGLQIAATNGADGEHGGSASCRRQGRDSDAHRDREHGQQEDRVVPDVATLAARERSTTTAAAAYDQNRVRCTLQPVTRPVWATPDDAVAAAATGRYRGTGRLGTAGRSVRRRSGAPFGA